MARVSFRLAMLRMGSRSFGSATHLPRHERASKRSLYRVKQMFGQSFVIAVTSVHCEFRKGRRR